MTNYIKYYPVGNGDQALISVKEDNYQTNILVDCNIKSSIDDTQFDGKADLLKELKKRKICDVDDASYVDVFILTHGDQDHLLGFENNFYQGSPSDFKKKHKEDGKIFIDVFHCVG